MKFSQIDRGTRAERIVEVELSRGKAKIALRPLTGMEESQVYAGAREFAKQHHGDAKPGDPQYELGIAVHTLAVGCLDVDSPPDTRTPFFDGGPEQILTDLAREEIAYLYERHELWQDECSPTVSKLSATDMLAELIKQVEAEDDDPFVRLRPGLRRALFLITARLCLSSPELRSRLGWPDGSASSQIGSKSSPNDSAPVFSTH